MHPNRTLVVGNRPWKVDAYVELSRGKTKRCQPIRITDPAASLATEDGNDTDDEFVAANAFRGAITGYVFKSDDKGLGYYRDSTHADAGFAKPNASMSDSEDTVANATDEHARARPLTR